jgi:hypothetical protein
MTRVTIRNVVLFMTISFHAEGFSVSHSTIKKSQQSSGSSLTSATTSISGVAPLRYQNTDTTSLTLIPLSTKPLIMVSSQPIANKEECALLMDFFDLIRSSTDAPPQHHDAWPILERIQNQLDTLLDSPHHEGESALPRYLIYNPERAGDEARVRNAIAFSARMLRKKLLPDGLHVDTNNSKHFRHITTLLYLTTNVDGATTFPLANADGKRDAAIQAANSLINEEVTHTQMVNANAEHCELLEEAALRLYANDNESGIRVLPEEGKLCVFYNLQPSGLPDPFSFHGGEALLQGETKKAVLTFFKEISLKNFSTREEFAEQAAQARQRLIDLYIDNS